MTISVVLCPHCGVELELTANDGGGDRGGLLGRGARDWSGLADLGGMHRQPQHTFERAFRSYNQGPGASAQQHWREVRYEEPARAASVQADVQVPALQAIVSGFFLGAGVCVVGVLAIVLWGAAWAWWVPLAAGAVAGLATAGLSWSNLLVDSRALLRKSESFIADAEPEFKPESISVEVVDDASQRMTYDTLTHAPEVKRAFQALAGGRIPRLSTRMLQDVGIGSVVARTIMGELRAGAFVDFPNGENAGAELTARGRALLRKLS